MPVVDHVTAAGDMTTCIAHYTTALSIDGSSADMWNNLVRGRHGWIPDALRPLLPAASAFGLLSYLPGLLQLSITASAFSFAIRCNPRRAMRIVSWATGPNR